jgi:hypothetical protein
MFKTEPPLTFVSVSILPLVHPKPIGFALGPLSDVRIPKDALPNALAFFKPLFPFAFVDFAIEPSVNAFPVGLVIFEFSFILISVRIPLHASAVPIVVKPLSFVNPGCTVVNDPESVPLAID